MGQIYFGDQAGKWVRFKSALTAGLGRYVLPASFTDPTIVPVWGSRIEVNAKNSFGGYTGFKAWMFYYSKGVLFVVEDAQGTKQWVGQSSSYTGLQKAVSGLRQ